MLGDERLSLPHPRMHQRRFVLEPLAEIAADILHPVLRHSVAELARLCREEQSAADHVTRIDDPGWHREAPPGPALHAPPVR